MKKYQCTREQKMKIKNLFFFALILSCSWGYCDEKTQQRTESGGEDMNHIIEHQNKKFFIGLELRTNNEECSLAMPAHKEKFFKENILSKIPNRVNGNILALYTDYEGDYTKPYSWILGCEVSNLEQVPKGLVGKIIPESKYAIFTTQGEFPKGLIAAWQDIWKSNLHRSYTSDFEVYRSDFDPQHNPEVKVYIAVEDALLKSVIQGRFDTFRSGSVYSPLSGADFKETDQNCLYAWGMDYVCGNGVMEKNGERIPTEEEIDRAIEYFSSKNLPFMWWSSAKILETKGFQFGGILTGIALDISQELPSKPSASSDLKIKIVQSGSELKTFTELAANAFAMNPKATEQWLALNDSLLKRNEQIYFMAYLNGVPVGTATLSVSPSSAGVWNLATIPEHRQHGIGGALVHAALIEAKKRQYSRVMAILMPKGLAWGLFAKLGFQAVCEFPFYIYGVSAEELEK
jgi:predicted transcriptional regulator YdeE/GNAT superfamily N-acetyltransferase